MRGTGWWTSSTAESGHSIPRARGSAGSTTRSPVLRLRLGAYVGRLRGGKGRFRGLRLVHTHLRNEPLTRDDLTDLALLRLDAVAAIAVDAAGRPGKLYVGHLVADGPVDRPWRELAAEQATSSTLDFAELIATLETDFGRIRRVAETDRGKERALLVHVQIGGIGRSARARRRLGLLASSRSEQAVDHDSHDLYDRDYAPIPLEYCGSEGRAFECRAARPARASDPRESW